MATESEVSAQLKRIQNRADEIDGLRKLIDLFKKGLSELTENNKLPLETKNEYLKQFAIHFGKLNNQMQAKVRELKEEIEKLNMEQGQLSNATKEIYERIANPGNGATFQPVVMEEHPTTETPGSCGLLTTLIDWMGASNYLTFLKTVGSANDRALSPAHVSSSGEDTSSCAAGTSSGIMTFQNRSSVRPALMDNTASCASNNTTSVMDISSSLQERRPHGTVGSIRPCAVATQILVNEEPEESMEVEEEEVYDENNPENRYNLLC